MPARPVSKLARAVYAAFSAGNRSAMEALVSARDGLVTGVEVYFGWNIPRK